VHPKKLLIAVIVIMLGTTVPAAVRHGKAGEDDSVFSHKDIYIASGQRVEQLLVSTGNAVVAGTVREGIMVVDGSSTVLPGAKIGGKIIVLGGSLQNESAAMPDNAAWVIPPRETPYTGTLLAGLTLLLITGLVAAPYCIWLTFRLAKRAPVVMRLSNRLLDIQHRRPVLYLGITFAVSAAMLIIFSVLAWKTIFRQAAGVFDNAFIWMVRYFASPDLDRIMVATTNLGSGFSFGVVVVVAAAILAIFRRWAELKGLIICLLGGSVLNVILKQLFERARPEDFQLVAAPGYSFPSGHAMVSLCFYGMITYLIVRHRSWHWRIAGVVTTTVLVVAIGISRVYLGAHYPSDVVAGYTAGATWLGFSVSLVMWWERERIRPKM
jgi:undecaprenyl-diphosphatase